ncbi:hypothetical protein BOVAC1_1390 [Bacteroides ovatus]|uniref:Uncharacterized protein n=1 Tax=Bacteroides xylanisolvens SD CC 1b TaxID=702447 RepID=W6PB70_9BACE|nr:hypothetical protein BOVAC1_1390 [Bacteroides ovatus]CDL99017.1 hypothetical protein BN891_19220 [Bacteroides xylanisolvens SD CC 2a]CDM07311.1 hypothetical protein BN890_49350 [Bacteroides xylanisolvens SD CC 1b]
MFMIRKYTHHLMSGKGIRENFERTLFFCRIKKVQVIYGISVKSASL